MRIPSATFSYPQVAKMSKGIKVEQLSFLPFCLSQTEKPKVGFRDSKGITQREFMFGLYKQVPFRKLMKPVQL